MAGENVASSAALHPSVAVSSSSASASQSQQLSALPAASPTPGATSSSSIVVNSGQGQVPAASGAAGRPGLGHQPMGAAQQSSQNVPQGSHQTIGAAGAGQSVSLPGQHMNLQSLHQQPTSAAQHHAANLSQGQAFGQNQQNLAQSAALNQMNFQQTQQQKQVSATRPQHAQYAQTQVNSPNMQAQGLSQQATSPAMVQSPPGTHSIPRTPSSQRLNMQLPTTTMAAARASQFAPGAIPAAGSGSSLQQQQQQQQLLAQRAAQVQGAVSSQQRPLQTIQGTQQNQQHSSMQSGQTGTQGPHQQVTSSAMMVPSSTRPLYGSQYIQQQQMGGLARSGIGGQATGHPSMLPVPGSSQLSSLQPQFVSQQMQGRQKQGQVQASQFPTSATAGPQMQIGMMAIGSQLVRPSGSSAPQQQRLQQIQTRPSQQQQQQLAQQQTSLTSPQKLQAQQLQRPSVSSVATVIQSSPQSAAGSGLQTQQPWIQKQMHHPMLQQQAAQQKQAQAQHSLQLHPQSQQAHLSQQTQQQQPQQQQQLGRVQPSAVQRPPTPTGVQPGTPVSGSTTPGGAMSQPSEAGNRILGKRSIQELVAQVDPNERLDPEVEDILLEIADDFIESVTTFACKLAKHRKSNILEAKDVLLHLNRNWDINIPGFVGEEYRAYKRTSVSETHKQRLALIKKSMSNQPTGQESKASGGQAANASAGTQAPMAA